MGENDDELVCMWHTNWWLNEKARCAVRKMLRMYVHILYKDILFGSSLSLSLRRRFGCL